MIIDDQVSTKAARILLATNRRCRVGRQVVEGDGRYGRESDERHPPSCVSRQPAVDGRFTELYTPPDTEMGNLTPLHQATYRLLGASELEGDVPNIE